MSAVLANWQAVSSTGSTRYLHQSISVLSGSMRRPVLVAWHEVKLDWYRLKTGFQEVGMGVDAAMTARTAKMLPAAWCARLMLRLNRINHAAAADDRQEAVERSVWRRMAMNGPQGRHLEASSQPMGGSPF